ncbi:MAG: translation initiation factor [Coraliomargarita sp.]
MSKRTNRRIATDDSNRFGSNPFGALDSGGLPAGPTEASAPTPKRQAKKGRVEVRREKAGRGGKTVTTLKAFAGQLPLGELAGLAFELKKSCACGGTLKGREIELQGDVVDRVLSELERRGFQAVKSGG